MADNLSAGGAGAALDAWGAVAGFVQLHKGSPGTDGTGSPSSVTTRQAVTWASADGGVLTASNVPEWTAWAGDDGEDVSDISFWDDVSTGAFQGSIPLSSTVTMNLTDSLSVTPISVTLPTAS